MLHSYSTLEILGLYEAALGRKDYALADDIRGELEARTRERGPLYWKCPAKHLPDTIQQIGKPCYVCGIK